MYVRGLLVRARPLFVAEEGGSRRRRCGVAADRTESTCPPDIPEGMPTMRQTPYNGGTCGGAVSLCTCPRGRRAGPLLRQPKPAMAAAQGRLEDKWRLEMFPPPPSPEEFLAAQMSPIVTSTPGGSGGASSVLNPCAS
uniref:Uncharacterized protein n=1 Tax=Odontella aurita TaxID=265563 RepID=A0A7S4JA34_9STRA|mmetsp:Transcript_4236/g.11732  ORF Transcript_4236/g.11732 Transcript_4236/m.11732 type:complete len:138 (+) Transcript_4236:269-682(+)